MKVVENVSELIDQIETWKRAGNKIALVPTMGFFHEGHLALMKEARRQGGKTVVSVFVNPRQFGPSEDLEQYPRDTERDINMAEEVGVDMMFFPSVEVMYPPGYQTTISLTELSKWLCGASRPGHFEGVAIVVAKLFNLVRPDIAIFGQKDYQQLALIRQMVKDLNFGISIIGHPIVREKDGLAMSSRNANLEATERGEAVCLYRALQHGVSRIRQMGEIPVSHLQEEIRDILLASKTCKIDYIEVVDPQTLAPKAMAVKKDILALAAFFGEKVRLIDNIVLE